MNVHQNKLYFPYAGKPNQVVIIVVAYYIPSKSEVRDGQVYGWVIYFEAQLQQCIPSQQDDINKTLMKMADEVVGKTKEQGKPIVDKYKTTPPPKFAELAGDP